MFAIRLIVLYLKLYSDTVDTIVDYFCDWLDGIRIKSAINLDNFGIFFGLGLIFKK